jgi:hypothetical protein
MTTLAYHIPFQIASSSRTIFNFAEGYGKLAQEQHTSRPIPERLPTEKEVADMLGNVDYIRRSLESVRDVVQQSNRNELAREGSGKSAFDDDDVMMYDSNKQPPYGNSDGKKRRGVRVRLFLVEVEYFTMFFLHTSVFFFRGKTFRLT